MSFGRQALAISDYPETHQLISLRPANADLVEEHSPCGHPPYFTSQRSGEICCYCGTAPSQNKLETKLSQV